MLRVQPGQSCEEEDDESCIINITEHFIFIEVLFSLPSQFKNFFYIKYAQNDIMRLQWPVPIYN